MPIINYSSRLIFFVGLTILSVLTQEILIDQLKSHENSLNEEGKIKTVISPVISDQIKGVSMFGWIRILSTKDSGYIFAFCQETCSNIDSTTSDGVFLFYLQFVSWKDQTLRFSAVENEDEIIVSSMTISPTELDSWLFVYLGHSFERSRQSYYKYSPSSSQLVIMDKVMLKPEQMHSYPQYQLITGISQFQSKNFFIGEIQRLTIQFGEEAYRENNLSDLHALHPNQFAQINCSYFFSKCAYQGYTQNACEAANRPTMKTVKSVLLKNAHQNTICFEGKKIIVKKNIECITRENWVDLQQSGSIVIESFFNNECLE